MSHTHSRRLLVHSARNSPEGRLGGNTFEIDGAVIPEHWIRALIGGLTRQNGTIVQPMPGVRPLGHGYSLRHEDWDGLSIWLINAGPGNEPVIVVMNHQKAVPGTGEQHTNADEVLALEGWRSVIGGAPFINHQPVLPRNSDYTFDTDKLLKASANASIAIYQPTGFTGDMALVASDGNAVKVIEHYDGTDKYRLRNLGLAPPMDDADYEIPAPCNRQRQSPTDIGYIGLGEQLPIRVKGSGDDFSLDPNCLSDGHGQNVEIEVDMGSSVGTIGANVQQHSRLALVLFSATGSIDVLITAASVDDVTASVTYPDTETISSMTNGTPQQAYGQTEPFNVHAVLYRAWDEVFVTEKYFKNNQPGQYPIIKLTNTGTVYGMLVYRAAEPLSKEEDDEGNVPYTEVWPAFAWEKEIGSYRVRSGHSMLTGAQKFSQGIEGGWNIGMHGFPDPLPPDEPTHLVILLRKWDKNVNRATEVSGPSTAFYAVRRIPIRQKSDGTWWTNSGFDAHDVPLSQISVVCPHDEKDTFATNDSWPGGLLTLGGCSNIAVWNGAIWAWNFAKYQFKEVTAAGNGMDYVWNPSGTERIGTSSGYARFTSEEDIFESWMMGRVMVFKGRGYTIRRIIRREAGPIITSWSATAITTGNGVMSKPVPASDAPEETWTLTYSSGSGGSEVWTVVGSVSGAQDNATTGVPYDNGIVAFTIQAGTVDFAGTDAFTFDVEDALAELEAMNSYDGTTGDTDKAYLSEVNNALQYTINDALFAEVSPNLYRVTLPEDDEIRALIGRKGSAMLQGARKTFALAQSPLQADAIHYQDAVQPPSTRIEVVNSESGAASQRAVTLVDGAPLTYTGRGFSAGVNPDSMQSVTDSRNRRLWGDLVDPALAHATQLVYDAGKKMVLAVNMRGITDPADGVPEWGMMLDAQSGMELGLAYPFPAFAAGLSRLKAPETRSAMRDGLMIFFVDVSTLGTGGAVSQTGPHLVTYDTIGDTWASIYLGSYVSALEPSLSSDTEYSGTSYRTPVMGLDGLIRTQIDGVRIVVASTGGLVEAAEIWTPSMVRFVAFAATWTGKIVGLCRYPSGSPTAGFDLVEFDNDSFDVAFNGTTLAGRRYTVEGDAFAGLQSGENSPRLLPAILIGPSGEIILTGYKEQATPDQYSLWLRRIDPETLAPIGEDLECPGYLDVNGSAQVFDTEQALPGNSSSPRTGIRRLAINKHGEVFFLYIDSSYNRHVMRYRFPCDGYTGAGGNAGYAQELLNLAVDDAGDRGHGSLFVDQRGTAVAILPSQKAGNNAFKVYCWLEDDDEMDVGASADYIEIHRSGYDRDCFGAVVSGTHIYYLVKDTSVSSTWKLIQAVGLSAEAGYAAWKTYDGGPEIGGVNASDYGSEEDGANDADGDPYTKTWDLATLIAGAGGALSYAAIAGNPMEHEAQNCEANGTTNIGHRNMGSF